MIEFFLAGHCYRSIVPIKPITTSFSFSLHLFYRKILLSLKIGFYFEIQPSAKEIFNFQNLCKNNLPLSALAKYPLTIQVTQDTPPPTDTFYRLSDPLSEIPSTGILSIDSHSLAILTHLLGIRLPKNFSIEILNKHLFNLTLQPPPALPDQLLKLPLPELRNLMNLVFQQSLSNPQMLAAYFSSLGEKGKMFLDTVSQKNKSIIKDYMQQAETQNLRWIQETSYLIYHNLYRLFLKNRSLPGLTAWVSAINGWHYQRLKAVLKKKPLFIHLSEILSTENYPKIRKNISAQDWSKTLSMLSETEIQSLLSPYISRRGLKLLVEDCQFAREQYLESDTLFAVRKLLKIVFRLTWVGHNSLEHISPLQPWKSKLTNIPLYFLAENLITSSEICHVITHSFGISTFFHIFRHILIDQSIHHRNHLSLQGILKNLFDDIKSGEIQLHTPTSVIEKETLKLMLLELYFFALI